jgi:hypothetical protein
MQPGKFELNRFNRGFSFKNLLLAIALTIGLGMALPGGVANAVSDAQLLAVGQPSLWSLQDVLLIFDQPMSATAMSNPSNYALTPPLPIGEARVDSTAPNLLWLKLSGESSLEIGTAYQIQATTGEDAMGESIDPALAIAEFVPRSLECEAENILACQLPQGPYSVANSDGAWNAGDPIWIVPYFACSGALGLLEQYRFQADSRYLDSVRAYALWHASQLRADGTITDYTGTYPAFSSTGDYDSSDSYPAMYLMTLWRYWQVTGDRAFLERLQGAIAQSVAAMELTLQSDWLTWAKPTYHMKYTMDNSEVFQGFFAAAQLARLFEDDVHYHDWLDKANQVRNAVLDQLYYGDTLGRYAIAKSNAGTLVGGWDNYYPDAMAGLMAIVYTHAPQSARTLRVWENTLARFSPQYVPDPSSGWLDCAVALLAGDSLRFSLNHVIHMKNHNNVSTSYYASHDSGTTIHVNLLNRPYAALVPGASEEAIAIDGVLDEAAWASAARLQFHPWGVMAGFDNRQTYDYPGNAIDPDPIYTLYLLSDGPILFVGLDAPDRFITTAAAAEDSDGLAPLWIRDAANPDVFHQVSYTFYPDAGASTIPTAEAGSALAQLSPDCAAFAFKPGNNTPNDSSDVDTGYRMEFRLDLRNAALGGYTSGTQDIQIGIRIADMDGTPGQAWPWANGAYGVMYQLSPGLDPEDYAIDRIRLLQPGGESAITHWSFY